MDSEVERIRGGISSVVCEVVPWIFGEASSAILVPPWSSCPDPDLFGDQECLAPSRADQTLE